MTDRSNLQTDKDVAVNFLELAVSGRIDEAYRKYVDMQGQHHNVYYPADFGSLKLGMLENHAQFPHKQIHVKRVLADGDLVAVHSNIVMHAGEAGVSVVHIFRFAQGKIVEMWDIGQPIPVDSPNQAGAF